MEDRESGLHTPVLDYGELRTNARGDAFARKELNNRWVSYTFFDESGNVRRSIALPRIPIISPEAIAASDAEEAKINS